MEKGCRSPAALSMFSQGFLRGGNNVFDDLLFLYGAVSQ